MHIRIRQTISGVLDGVSLSHLVPGFCYEVSESLGGYLVSTGAAEPVVLPVTSIVTADDSSDTPVFAGIAVVMPSETAADHEPRRRGHRLKRSEEKPKR